MNHLTYRCLIRAGAILWVVLAIAFFDVIFLNKTFKVTTANSQALPTGAYAQANNKPSFIPVNGTDSSVLEEPVYEFLKTHFAQGRFPLWNPHQACGYPLIGMIQVGIFYPLNLIMYVFPSQYSWDILILVRLWLAGFFTYAFLRTIRLRHLPALGGSIVFMLSGPMVLLQYWTANVDILTPLLLLVIERLLQRPTRRGIVLMAAAIAMTFFAGHPEHIFLVNAYAAAFLLFRLWSLRKQIQWHRVLPSLTIAYAAGIALSAMVLLPFLYNYRFELWHGHPGGTGLLMEEQRARALSLAMPHFFQAVPLTYQWSFAGWWGGYLGTIPLGLSFLSFFSRQRKGLNYFFAALAVIIIGKEYGLPVINWIGHLPLFNLPRYAIHTPPLAAFSIAVLSAMGIRAVLTYRHLFAKGLVYSAGLLLIAAVHMFFLPRESAQPLSLALKASAWALALLLGFQLILWIRLRRDRLRTIAGILLLILLGGELFSYIHRERPTRFDSFGNVPYIQFLKSYPQHVRSYGNFWAFYPNTASGFGVDDLGYFFGLVPKRFVSFVNRLLIPDHFKNDLRPPALRAIPFRGQEHILNLMNLAFIIRPASGDYARMFPHFPDIGHDYQKVYDKEVKIYKRPDFYPRAFIVHRAIVHPDPETSLALINQIGDQLRQVAVIAQPLSPLILQHFQKIPATDTSTASIISYTPNEVVIRAEMEHAGLVVLSDAYHPDWRASVDGNPTTVLQTDYLFRSVVVGPGTHTITFQFWPVSFFGGLAISLATLFALLVIGWGPEGLRHFKKNRADA